MWSEVNGTLGNVRWSHVRCPWNKLVTENAKENAKRSQSLTPWLTITKDVLRWELIVYLGNGRKRVRPRSDGQKFFVAPHLEYIDIILDWKVLVIGECLVLEKLFANAKDCDQLISQLVHLRFSVVMIDQRSLTHQYSVWRHLFEAAIKSNVWRYDNLSIKSI